MKLRSAEKGNNTSRTSCWGDEDNTVERSSMLFLATSNASLVCSGVKLRTGISRWSCMSCWSCCARLASTSGAETEREGVKIGAKLSLSRPGKRIPLDFKLYNREKDHSRNSQKSSITIQKIRLYLLKQHCTAYLACILNPIAMQSAKNWRDIGVPKSSSQQFNCWRKLIQGLSKLTLWFQSTEPNKQLNILLFFINFFPFQDLMKICRLLTTIPRLQHKPKE